MRRTVSAATLAAVLLTGTAAAAQTGANAPAVVAEAAAQPSPPRGPGHSDPFERTNRAFFGLNQFLDRILIRPVSVFYKRATPRPIREGIHNFLGNLGEPVVFLNDVLQVHPAAAGTTLGRFALNSTLGVGGFFDVATGAGAPHHDNGFGTTLGRYHAPLGPYLFIPVLGPSSIREALGTVVDTVSDPLFWARYPYDTESGVARTVAGGLDARSRADKDLKSLYDMSTDPYAALRSVYLQNRQAAVQGGQVDLNALPDFGDEPATPGAAASAPATPDAPTTAPPTEAEQTPEASPTSQPSAPTPPASSPPVSAGETPPSAAPAPGHEGDQALLLSSHQMWTRSAGAM